MKKFCIATIIMIITCVSIFSANVFAGEMFDYSVDSDICRFSDYYDETNTLPFMRISSGRIEIDKATFKSGMAISTKAINVIEDLSKFQVFVSQDRIDINKDIENAILISPTVVIDGTVKETVIVFSGNLTLKENSNVIGEIIASAQNLTCEGKIEGNVIATCGNVEVSASSVISGGLRVYTDSLNISESSNITGKVYCKSANDITVPNIQKDFVNIVKTEIKQNGRKVNIPVFSIVITALIFGAIYILVDSKSKIFTKISEKITSKIAFVFISGLIAVIASIPLILIFILISIFGLLCIGIPLIIVFAGVMLLSISIRIFVFGSIISKCMLKTKYGDLFNSKLKKFILSVIVFISSRLLEYIPAIGTYITYLYVVVSIGMFITLLVKSKESNK